MILGVRARWRLAQIAEGTLVVHVSIVGGGRSGDAGVVVWLDEACRVVAVLVQL